LSPKTKKRQKKAKIEKGTSKKPSRKKAVVKEVERGAAKVEKEITKVEREVKKEARRVEKEVKGEFKGRTEPKPTGRIPQAMVIARHGTGTITREGRGFSIGELSGSGLAPGLATKWGVRMDPRRRSVVEGNVGLLRDWQTSPGMRVRVEGEGKRVEKELERAGKAVEKGSITIEREVVKAAKEVEQEAKKTEKAIKGKVEKQKARPKKEKA
jgi:ribosomal protein L13E